MAFSISVPDNVISASYRTSIACKMGNRNNGSDGTQEQQLVGVIGQNMALQAIGKPMMETKDQHDGGVDFSLFGKKFDIKTMGRSVPPQIDYVNNFIESQFRFDVDGYIFASLNKINMKLSICGWLPKDEMKLKAVLYKKGQIRTRNDETTFEMKANTYEIPNREIRHTAKSWCELFVEIYKWSIL